MVSALAWALVLGETALALSIPVARDLSDSVDTAKNDYNAISSGAQDMKNGDYRKGWDKLPKWAKITIIVVSIVVVLIIIGIISCLVGCVKCVTCNCCSCCCPSGGCCGGGGGGRTREVHHYHDVPGGTRNSYLPMNDMSPTPTVQYEPKYEPPQYAVYEPMRR